MALERQSIEKKDFPIGRRGYDPEAVDAHLKAIADEVEEFRKSSPGRPATLASAASDRVRAIVEAAETSAAEIRRQAEEEAQQIRAEARSTREQADAQTHEYLDKVSESTATMRQRLDAMESELGALLESLRTGSTRLNADLQLLERNLADVRESVTPGAASAPATPAAPKLPLDTEPVETAAATTAEAAEPQVSAKGGEVQESGLDDTPVKPAAEAPARASANGGDDTEGARLIALNMALNGTPRDETERYLADNFQLADRGALLDEVYASVEG